MPENEPNNTLWRARALAQKMPGGEELDAILVTFQVEREKVRAILDAMHFDNTDNLSFIDLAESASAVMAALEKDRDDLLDKLEGQAAACAEEGRDFVGIERDPEYHAIAKASTDAVLGREGTIARQQEVFDLAGDLPQE